MAKGLEPKWITSDLHFGHKNILTYNAPTRPYKDVEHMDASMIEEWNSKVEPSDQVLVLGDFSFYKPARTVEILKQLRGQKILVVGNHDRHLLKSVEFVAQWHQIHEYLEINHDGTKVCLFHYPIFSWNGVSRGSVMLHGHMHGHELNYSRYRILDVGLDATSSVVSHFPSMVEKAITKEVLTHGNE